MSCVIVDKNRVVSVGYNKCQTHPKSNHGYKQLHAELGAIIGMEYSELKGCTAYVYRENKQGEPRMAKPCPTCEAALREVGIKKVCYSIVGGYTEMYL